MLGGTNGNNHASPVEYKDKWYLFYHDRKLKNRTDANSRPSGISTDGEKRSVGVEILEYNSDGTIKQATITTAGPAQIKNLNPYDTVRAVTVNTMYGIGTAASTGGSGNEGGTGNEGKQILTGISNNDWIRVKGVDFGAGANKFKVRAAAAGGSSGSIELRTGSNTGTLIGTCNIASTGGWTAWNTFECDVDVSGVKDFLYLVFKGSSSELFRLDWYMFDSDGTTSIGGKNTVRGNTRPLVTIKGRTLNVNAGSGVDSKVSIRLVNMTGKTVANFNASGNAKLSLKTIPAGAYIVEARRMRDGYRTMSAVMLR